MHPTSLIVIGITILVMIVVVIVVFANESSYENHFIAKNNINHTIADLYRSKIILQSATTSSSNQYATKKYGTPLSYDLSIRSLSPLEKSIIENGFAGKKEIDSEHFKSNIESSLGSLYKALEESYSDEYFTPRNTPFKGKISSSPSETSSGLYPLIFLSVVEPGSGGHSGSSSGSDGGPYILGGISSGSGDSGSSGGDSGGGGGDGGGF